MSVHHVYEISCNARDCGERYADGSVRAHQARSNAARAGWRHVVVPVTKSGPAPTVDLCPAHHDVDPQTVLPRRSA